MPMRCRSILATTLLAAFLAAPDLAFAQEAAPAPPSPSAPRTTPDGAPADDDPCAARPGESSSDSDTTSRLAECGGVLTPPAMPGSDIPQAPVPDPDPDTTPVVPPDAVPEQPANPT